MSEKIKLRLNLPCKLSLLKVKVFPSLEYNLRAELRERDPFFRLMFGPPFTSGEAHLGTLYIELLKDVISSSLFLTRLNVKLRPGFDCHGLPTEIMTIKNNPSLLNSSSKELYEACLKTSRTNLIRQVALFTKFNLIADWQSPYITASIDYVNTVISSLRTLALQGMLYLGRKELDYCTVSNSIVPLSEKEVRDIQVTEVVYGFKLLGRETFILIWTTTP